MGFLCRTAPAYGGPTAGWALSAQSVGGLVRRTHLLNCSGVTSGRPMPAVATGPALTHDGDTAVIEREGTVALSSIHPEDFFPYCATLAGQQPWSQAFGHNCQLIAYAAPAGARTGTPDRLCGLASTVWKYDHSMAATMQYLQVGPTLRYCGQE